MDIPDGDIAVATARHETLSIGSELSRAAAVVGDLQAALIGPLADSST